MIVYLAIKVAAADGEYSQEEHQKICEMAQLMGVSSEVVEQFVEIHKEEKELREKRIKLAFPNGLPY